MPVLSRSLSVMLDGEPFSFSGRMHLRGEDELSLFPALFTLELWNLPEENYLRVFRCREIAVSCGESCLVSGTVSDVFRHPAGDGILTTVAISLGLNLWEATVSLTVPAGTSLLDVVRQILSASGTGICLLADLENDSRLVRSQSFFGRVPECIDSVLSAVFARAMLTPSGLMIVPPGGLPNPVHIGENDLTDAPAFVNGGKWAILPCTVSGWRPGQTAEVRWKDVSFRGIIRSRLVDADTGSGPWKCEMILEVL